MIPRLQKPQSLLLVIATRGYEQLAHTDCQGGAQIFSGKHSLR